MVKARAALVVGAPLVAVATLMIGLRIGAGESFRAAAVYAAPRANGTARLAWQVLTYLEDRGVREVVPIADLRVVARNGGRETRWSGSSNIDGIAEIELDLDGDAIDVTIASAEEPLGRGRVLVPPGRAKPQSSDRVVPFSKREGEVAIDVLVEGDRLVVGYPSTAWARVSPPTATLAFEPEAGLMIESTKPPACDGWAELSLVAQIQVAGLRIEGRAGDKHGVWFGALPVAAGAFGIGLPRTVARKSETAVLLAPNPRTVVYAEIDDERGRVLAATLPVTRTAEDPTPRATFVIPPLQPGLHWLVASGEPRGAETMSGATMARPFLVSDTSEPACAIGPRLARHAAPGFPRVLAFDGVETRGASNRARRRLGLAIGLGSLLTAAILEVLLLTAASQEARDLLARAEEADTSKRLTRRSPGGGLAIALLVALLGFALLTALLVAKA